MVRTYKAEGRQIAYVLRGLFTILALSLYFINPKLHWGIFVGVFFVGLIIAEVLGLLGLGKGERKRRLERVMQLGPALAQLQEIRKHERATRRL